MNRAFKNSKTSSVKPKKLPKEASKISRQISKSSAEKEMRENEFI
jgi:hypothetical protein